MYPLKFRPLLKDKIWGGHKLQQIFGKDPHGLPNIGESWELSGYPNDLSEVSNGHLEGKTLKELIELYREELLGNHIYEKYGTNFPLLFKLIDANDDLSIQVHPNDEIAMKRHHSLGKTEMWYVVDAEEGASLIAGFTEDTEKEAYQAAVENGTVESLLQKVSVQSGDVIFIPAGLVHAIGKGVMVAEIQESSDITYRIYDYNRVDDKGNRRELHVEEALDVINFKATKNPKVNYQPALNEEVLLVGCKYFNTILLEIDKPKSFFNLFKDSFDVYMCLEGKLKITGGTIPVTLKKGETVMIPASLREYELIPSERSRLLRVFIPKDD